MIEEKITKVNIDFLEKDNECESQLLDDQVLVSYTILRNDLKTKLFSKKQLNSDSKKTRDRDQWGNGIEFLFSCIAMSVGLGNIWRFPAQGNGLIDINYRVNFH